MDTYLRFDGEWRIPLYPIATDKFMRKDFNSEEPIQIENSEGCFKFKGFKKIRNN